MARYAITFEVWDEAAVEVGDTDDRGYVVEWTEATLDDIWDMRREWSCAQNDNNGMRWTNPEDVDFRTGECRIETLHLEGFDGDAVTAIFGKKVSPDALGWMSTAYEIKDARCFSDRAKLERCLELLEEMEGRATFDTAGLSLVDVMHLEDVLGLELSI